MFINWLAGSQDAALQAFGQFGRGEEQVVGVNALHLNLKRRVVLSS